MRRQLRRASDKWRAKNLHWESRAQREDCDRHNPSGRWKHEQFRDAAAGSEATATGPRYEDLPHWRLRLYIQAATSALYQCSQVAHSEGQGADTRSCGSQHLQSAPYLPTHADQARSWRAQDSDTGYARKGKTRDWSTHRLRLLLLCGAGRSHKTGKRHGSSQHRLWLHPLWHTQWSPNRSLPRHVGSPCWDKSRRFSASQTTSSADGDKRKRRSNHAGMATLLRYNTSTQLPWTWMLLASTRTVLAAGVCRDATRLTKETKMLAAA